MTPVNIQAYYPKGALKEFVDCIHYLGGEQIGTGIAFPRVNQVIIINLGSNFTSTEVYKTTSPSHELTASVWMNGKQDDPFMLGNRGITSMYAIGIKLGMMPYFAAMPACETNDQAVDAIHWSDKDIFNLREKLLGCATIADGFILIEKFLIRMLGAIDLTNFEKIKWLSGAVGNYSVSQITHTLGTTRKRLRSEAQYFFGSSIKNIQGIMRLNQVLSAIAHRPHQTLSSLHNYYDQSHFVNDFKAHTGITPLQYKKLCQQYPFIKYTPNFIAVKKETFLQFISA